MVQHRGQPPVCGCCPTCLILGDTFNRANGPLGSDWEIRRGTWGIQTSQAETDDDDALAIAVAENDADSGIVCAIFPQPGNEAPPLPGAMLVGAYRDDGNYLFGIVQASSIGAFSGFATIELWERREGVATLLASCTGPIGTVSTQAGLRLYPGKLCWDAQRVQFTLTAGSAPGIIASHLSCSSDHCLAVGRRAGMGVYPIEGAAGPWQFDDFAFSRNAKDHANCPSCLSCRDHCLSGMPRRLYVRFPYDLFASGVCAEEFNGVEHALEPLARADSAIVGLISQVTDCQYVKPLGGNTWRQFSINPDRYYRIRAWFDQVILRWHAQLEIADNTINSGFAGTYHWRSTNIILPEECGGMLRSIEFFEFTGFGLCDVGEGEPTIGPVDLRGDEETGLDCYYGGGGDDLCLRDNMPAELTMFVEWTCNGGGSAEMTATNNINLGSGQTWGYQFNGVAGVGTMGGPADPNSPLHVLDFSTGQCGNAQASASSPGSEFNIVSCNPFFATFTATAQAGVLYTGTITE